MEHRILKIALDTPLDIAFDYRWTGPHADTPPPAIGQLALVPFGRRQEIGVVVGSADVSELAPAKLKDVLALRDELPPLPPAWLALCGFAAEYYQRPLGEVMLPALPKNLRAAKPLALQRALKWLDKQQAEYVAATQTADNAAAAAPALNPA
ncbi:MAG: primosomal protein N', partial [Burkholderiaceae bacterium]